MRRARVDNKALHERTGLSRAALYRIEQGKVRVRPENKHLIERVLGERVDWLATEPTITEKLVLSDWFDCEAAFITLIKRINGMQNSEEKAEFIYTARRYLQRMKK